jgi:hypothetical protein
MALAPVWLWKSEILKPMAGVDDGLRGHIWDRKPERDSGTRLTLVTIYSCKNWLGPTRTTLIPSEGTPPVT